MSAMKIVFGVASLAVASLGLDVTTFEMCSGPIMGVGIFVPANECVNIPLSKVPGQDPPLSNVSVLVNTTGSYVQLFNGAGCHNEDMKPIPLVCDQCVTQEFGGSTWGVKQDCSNPDVPPVDRNDTDSVIEVETCGELKDSYDYETSVVIGECIADTTVPSGPGAAIQVRGTVDSPTVYLFNEPTCTSHPWAFAKLTCDCLGVPTVGGISLDCGSSGLSTVLIVIIVLAVALVIIGGCITWYLIRRCKRATYDAIVQNN